MSEPEPQLWARRPHARHAELFDAEYAKQLERIERIRSEVSESLALPAPPEAPVYELVPRGAPRPARWDAAPSDFAPAPVAPPRRAPVAARRDAAPGGVARLAIQPRRLVAVAALVALIVLIAVLSGGPFQAEGAVRGATLTHATR